MHADEAAEERYRLSPNKFSPPSWPAGDDPCPPRLGDLALRARELHERLMRLDDSLFEAEVKPADNPVASQLSQLSAAFSEA